MKTQKERNWDEILDALRYTHTISMRDMCEMLKVSRSWVNRYILSNMKDVIYLNNAIRADKPSKYSINWAYIASLQLKKENIIKDSVWCDENEFKNIIYTSITSVTKQTKLVPREYFVQNKDAYIFEYNYIQKKIKEKQESLKKVYSINTLIEINKLKEEQEKYFQQLLSPSGKILLKEGETDIVARTKAIPVTVALPKNVCIKDWVAPHDIKKYGDTDEKIYRHFFKNGYIRIELAITDSKGLASKKVYYITDPELLNYKYIDSYITVKEEVYQKVKNNLNMV